MKAEDEADDRKPGEEDISVSRFPLTTEQKKKKKPSQQRLLAADNSARFAAGSRLAQLEVIPTGATASGIHGSGEGAGSKTKGRGMLTRLVAPL